MIACLSIPYFAAAVERRAAGVDADPPTPLAIGGQPWEAKPIFAFSQEVARQGVKAGMSLRLAHVLSPEARFLPATPPRYRQAAGEIIDVLLDFSPAVEPQEAWAGYGSGQSLAGADGAFPVDSRLLPVRYLLDFDTLPAAESLELAREMGRLLREATRFAPAVGLAAGRFAAQVAATLSRSNHARLVEPGSDAAFLAAQSIAFLPLDDETLRRLRLLGIDTLGGLARLPRAALLDQFGPAIEPLHRLARGQPPAASPSGRGLERGQAHEFAGHTFDPPLADRLVLEAVIRRLAGQVAGRLAAAGLAAAGIYLAWETDGGRRDQAALTLRRPSADERHLAEAWLELSRGAEGKQGGITAITLGTRDTAAATARQMSLFDEAGEQRLRETWAAVRALMARYPARDDDPAVGIFLRPVPAEPDHPLPERRFRWAEAGGV